MRIMVDILNENGTYKTVRIQINNCQTTKQFLQQIKSNLQLKNISIIYLKRDSINFRVIEGWSLQHYHIKNGSHFRIEQVRQIGSKQSQSISTLTTIVQNNYQQEQSDEKLSQYSEQNEKYRQSFISSNLQQSNSKYLDDQLQQALNQVRMNHLNELAQILRRQPVQLLTNNLEQFILIRNKYIINELGQCGRNLLHWAIHNDNIDIVSFLLIKSCDLNICTLDDYTPLQLAVCCHSTDIIKLLLIQSTIDINKVTKHGTALHLAIEKQQQNIICILLQNYANIEIGNQNDQKPSDLAKNNKKILNLIKKITKINHCYQVPNIVSGIVQKMGRFRSKLTQMTVNPFKNLLHFRNIKNGQQQKQLLTRITNIIIIKQQTIMMNNTLYYFKITLNDNTNNELNYKIGIKNENNLHEWIKQIQKCCNYCNQEISKYKEIKQSEKIIKNINDKINKIIYYNRKNNQKNNQIQNNNNKLSISIINLSNQNYNMNNQIIQVQEQQIKQKQFNQNINELIVEKKFNELIVEKKQEQNNLNQIQQAQNSIHINDILFNNGVNINEFKNRFSENIELNKSSNLINKMNEIEQQQNYRKTIYISEIKNKKQISFNNFKILKQIGNGSFGKIFLTQEKKNQKIYAMKVLNKKKLSQKNILKYAISQTNILKKVNYPFIIKLYYSFQTSINLYLIMDYCPNGDLSQFLLKKQKLSQNSACFIIAQLILAINYLHQIGIIYRDLKPENILIAKNGYIRLIDFGLSKEKNYSMSFCGSPAYLSPQMLEKKGVNFACDLYGIGCILYEMLVGQPPYFDENMNKLFQNIKTAKLKFPSYISTNTKSLINLLLQRQISKRIGFNDINTLKNHIFFKKINWQKLQKQQLLLPKQLQIEQNQIDLYVIDKNIFFHDQDNKNNNDKFITKINNFSFCREIQQQSQQQQKLFKF